MIIRNLKNKYKYFIDWSGSLFWIEVCDKDNEAIKELKSMILANDGYLTIIKKSENFEYSENIFTINDVKLMISKKLKKALTLKDYLTQEKCTRIFNADEFFRSTIKDKDNQSSEKIFKKCVHCGMCNATCPTYGILGDELDGPRKNLFNKGYVGKQKETNTKSSKTY